MRLILVFALLAACLLVFGCVRGTVIKEESCVDDESGESMSLTEAMGIAADSECVQGEFKGDIMCNSVTGTWWIDLNIEKEGCAPACVVDVVEKTAEINWRCTGVITESTTTH